MYKVFLFFNPERKDIILYIKKLTLFLKNNNVKVFVFEKNKKFLKNNNNDIFFINESQLTVSIPLIITVGGDGTIMKAKDLALYLNSEIVGINMGRLGFLTAIEKNDFEGILNIIKNKKNKSYRMLIDVLIKDENGKFKEYTALNDIVLKSFSSKIADINVFFNNEILKYRSDGIIISSPTGSTAYSLSSGGSIIEPNLDVLSLTPICSHSLFNKSIIFSTNTTLKIKIDEKNYTDVYLNADGYLIKKIEKNESIFIKKSEKKLKLVEKENDNYYKKLFEKLVSKGFNL